MPSPSFVSAATDAEFGASGTNTVTKPTSVTSGNVLIATGDEEQFTNRLTWTMPSGWTEIISPNASSSFFVAVKVAGGSEPSTYGFGFSGGNSSSQPRVTIVNYSGSDATTPVDVSAVAYSGNSVKPVSTPAVTASGGNETLIGIWGAAPDTVGTAPSGMTQRSFNSTGTVIAVYDLAISAAGAVASETLTWNSFQFAVPAAAVLIQQTASSGTNASVTGVAAALTVTGVVGTVTGNNITPVTGVAAQLTVTGIAGAVVTSSIVTGAPAALTVAKVAGFVRAGPAGTFTRPLVGVELDLAGSPFGAAFVGTDVTPSAVAGFGFSPINVTWGRQDQYGQVQPTTVTGAFQNVTGDLTPGRTASPYYPHIRRGLHRRISILANFINVPISDDFATTLSVDPTDPTFWTTDVEGSDLLTRYSGTPSSGNPNQRIAGTTLRSFIVEEMLLDAPIALYLFQENEGATTFSDVTGTHGVGTIHDSTVAPGYVDAGQEPIPPANGLTTTWYGGTFTQVTNPDYLTWQSGDAAGSWIGLPLHTPNSGGNATACTFELWVSTFPKKPLNYAVIVNGHQSFSIWIAHDGTVNFGDTTSNPPVAWATGPHIADGAVHQVAISWNGTSTLTAYVDGASVGTSTVSSALDSTPMNMGFGPGFTAPFIGGVAYWAMYGRVLPAPRINSHYHAGSDAFVGESTDRRITRLLSYRPNYGSVLDAGTVTMGVQDIQGRSLADCLLEVGVTEGGAVFVDGLGRVNFRARSRLVSPAVTVTLDCLAGDVQIGGSFRDDTQNVLNDVTVSTPSGSDQRYYDAASTTADGEFSTSLSVPLQTDAQALALATWMVTNGVQENLTFDTLTVNLMSCPAAIAAAVLALAPLDIVQVTNIDVNATRAPATTMTFVVQGGQLSLGADAMTAALNVTPMPV